MDNLKLEIFDDIVSVSAKMRDISGPGVDIWIPEGSVLFENSLNLRLIKKEAEKLGKSVTFSTPDTNGQMILDMIEGNGSMGVSSITEDFIPQEVTVESIVSGGRKKPSLPKFKIPSFRRFKLPRGKKLWMVIFGVILLFLIFRVAMGAPTAEVVITVESQPLVKSIELEVGTTATNDAKARTLQGKTFTATVTQTKKGPTSGEVQVGEKAKGTVKIYNYTDDEVELSEGHDLTGEDNDKNYNLLDDVTIPAATIVPGSPTVPEEVEAEVEAEEIGEDSNIDKDETLLVDDYTKSRVVAKTDEDIDNGKSEIVKAVTQKDMDDLSASLLTDMEKGADDALKAVIENGWILINGSESALTTTTEFNHKVGDQADEIELKQTVNFQGLAYNQKALDEILDVLLDEFIPDGFELSKQNREVQVEILGNTDATVLSTTAADLQVTLKSFILPTIDEEKIKNDLAGKKLSEAERILGSIRNIKSYELNMSFKIPFFTRMPSKAENITLTIKRD